MNNVLIYGAYGYTGALIAELAAASGTKPVLAGRDETKIRALGERLSCPYRAVGLDDPAKLDDALRDMDVVLHCAGPFSRTSAPMADACLRTKTHYLDITGEIAVLEALAARDQAAKTAGVMFLPGVGFDVVPSDCLALHLAERLPDATHLTLAFWGTSSQLSHGTMLTSLEIGGSGAVRQGRKIVPVPAAWKTLDVDFDGTARSCVSLAWGDVSTAYYSTGIPNIEVFAAVPAGIRRAMQASRYLKNLLRVAPVQRFLESRVPEGGPDAETRRTAAVHLWGRVTNAEGRSVEAQLRTPEAYQTTALAALLIAERAARGDAPLGFQTPAKAYGADLILEVAGTSRS